MIGPMTAIAGMYGKLKKKKKKKGFNSLKSGTAAEKKAYKKGMSGKSVNLKTGKTIKKKKKKKGPFGGKMPGSMIGTLALGAFLAKKKAKAKKKPKLGKVGKGTIKKKIKKPSKYKLKKKK